MPAGDIVSFIVIARADERPLGHSGARVFENIISLVRIIGVASSISVKMMESVHKLCHQQQTAPLVKWYHGSLPKNRPGFDNNSLIFYTLDDGGCMCW